MSVRPPPTNPVITGLTWRDFLDHPTEFKHADLIDGELCVNAPSLSHQHIVKRLLVAMDLWIAGGDARGEVTLEPPVQISDDRGYMPDIAWWPQERCAPTGLPPAFDGPPHLVIEVLSPSTRRIDLIRKRNDYPHVGVREIWMIDPDGPAAVIIRVDGSGDEIVDVAAGDDLCSPLLEGFAIRLCDLTAR